MSNSRDNGNFYAYLPINENNMRWDLYLTGIGEGRITAGAAYPPQGHPSIYSFRWAAGRVLPEFQVILISEGRGTFESEKTGRVAVEAGSALLLFPGVWHRYRPDRATGWKEHWISWNGEQLYRLMKKGVLSEERPVLKVDKPGEVLQAYDKIIEHVKKHPSENANVLSAYAMEILTLTMDNVHAVQQGRDSAIPLEYAHTVDDTIVFRALHIIWNHSYRNIRVDEIVDMLPVSRRTLERKFQATINRSIREELTHCRIERARHLLSSTKLPIKHIALSVGFAGSERMGKVFRQQFGLTPGQYRSEHAEL